jgi:hypothetical protein
MGCLSLAILYETGSIFLALEDQEIHMLEVGIPLGIPPLWIDDADILGCPWHPPINGNLKMKGHVTCRWWLKRVGVPSLDTESILDEHSILLESMHCGLLWIQKHD